MTSGLPPSPTTNGTGTSTNSNRTVNGTSTESPDSEEVLVKNHPIYYFSDGSLILDVETQRFRVHHTLVTRHSRYLSSGDAVKMWNLKEETKSSLSSSNGSDGDAGDNRGGGTPLNHVCIEPARKVRAEDIEALLKHLYHDVRLEDKTTSLTHIISLLRISSPPQFDYPTIHKTAREIFEASFPHSPEEFTHAHPEKLYEALPVAKEFGMRVAMKAIFYSLVSTTEFDVSNAPAEEGVNDSADTPEPKAQNGLFASEPESGSSHSESPPTVSPTLSLSAHDAQTCLTLMTALIAHFTPILFTAPAASHMECTDVFAGNWMPLVIQPAIDGDGVYRPLETLKRIREIGWEDVGLCASCAGEMRREWREEMGRIWREMDGWLGFEEGREGEEV